MRALAAVLCLGPLLWVWAGSAPARQLFPIDLSPQAPAQTQGGEGEGGEGDFVARALEQLDLGCDPLADQSLGGNPYADSIVGRRAPALMFDADQHRAAIAASLSQDPDLAFEYTAGLRGSADPALRYVGWLVPAYAVAKAVRPDYPMRLADLLDGLEREAGALPLADLDYLKAVLAAGRGDEAAALAHAERAVAAEPDFFNAILLALRLRLLAAGRADMGGFGACDLAYRELFRNLVSLVDLTRCPLQATQSEIYLSRMLRDPDSAPPMLAARVYLGVMARKPDYAAAALDRFDRLAEIPCKRSVSASLRRLVAAAERRSGKQSPETSSPGVGR